MYSIHDVFSKKGAVYYIFFLLYCWFLLFCLNSSFDLNVTYFITGREIDVFFEGSGMIRSAFWHIESMCLLYRHHVHKDVW